MISQLLNNILINFYGRYKNKQSFSSYRGGVIDNNLIPIASGDSSIPQVCSVSMLSSYVKSNIGVDIPAFLVTKDYVVGDLVSYGGKIYRFTSYKEAGSWDSSCIIETSIVNEISGMNVTPKENPQVVLSGLNNNSGKQVSLIQGSTTITGTTDSNGVCIWQTGFSGIEKGLVYTVQVNDEEGYFHLNPKSYTAAYNTRTINFKYISNYNPISTESVQVKVLKYDATASPVTDVMSSTNLSGKTIKCVIKDGEDLTSTFESEPVATFEDIPINSQYTIEFPDITGYVKPRNITYTANRNTRLINGYYHTYTYTEGEENVGILCNDGNEYDVYDYNHMNPSTRPQAVAIHCKSQLMLNTYSSLNKSGASDFYLKMEVEVATKQWLEAKVLVPGVSYNYSWTTDFTGISNTIALLSFTGHTSQAAIYSASKTIQVGNKTLRGFFPSTSEICQSYNLMNAIKAAGLNNYTIYGKQFSSTQYADANYVFFWTGYDFTERYSPSRIDSSYVVPFYAEYDLPSNITL